jgi:hypothetical protein
LPFDWNALPINDTIRLPWSSECLCLPNEPQPSESIVVIVFFDVEFLQNPFSEATMLTRPEEPRIPLSKGWQGCVNTAVRILVIPITCSGFIRLPARQAQQFLVAHSMVYNLLVVIWCLLSTIGTLEAMRLHVGQRQWPDTGARNLAFVETLSCQYPTMERLQ